MNDISYSPYEGQRPTEQQLGPKLLLVASFLAIVALLAGAMLLPTETPEEESAVLAVARVSHLVSPASLLQEMEQPTQDRWLMPAAAAVVDGAIFVLDTGNNRILKLDQAGRILAVFDDTSDGGPTLQRPMAIANDGLRLFVANSLASEVLVLDEAGQVQHVLPLPADPVTQRKPRPIGIAVTPDGEIVVSDADNHRVLWLDDSGRVVRMAGTGTRAGEADGFNVPGALAVDKFGNIYVVDTLNGRVVKLSPDGTFVRQFGRLGSTAGTLSRPKGVAVDGEGRVFVSDGLQAAVQVFNANGTYIGFIGREEPDDPASGSLFQAPAGLALDGNKLHVVDRFAGLITFELSSSFAPAAIAGEKD